jgi:hypothetical protein
MDPIGKRFGPIAAVVAMVGFGGGVDVAAQTAGMPATSSMEASGKIAALDLKQGALKLEVSPKAGQSASTSAQPTTFLLDEETFIIRGTEQLKPEQLKVGDQVSVEYEAEGGKHMARTIKVQVAGTGAQQPSSGAGQQPSTGQQSAP